MGIQDLLGRSLASLRISVTDRCNLRCGYCMPEEEYVWLERSALLSFEELVRLACVFASLGARKVRLTGGEPLLRRGLPLLVEMLARSAPTLERTLTTNGSLLAQQAAPLRSAGLSRLTISLDTLRRERFLASTRRDELERVLAGIAAATRAGFHPLKLNCVVQRGFNDDELADLLEFARAGGHELRFIEYMDVGGATQWDRKLVVSRAEILALLRPRWGDAIELEGDPSAPADRLRLSDGTIFGIIASTTTPFCRNCDRARLTADGRLFLCLYGRQGLDLALPLRAGASDAELARLVSSGWLGRQDRGAEERAELLSRTALATATELRERPHLEMHTRGG